MPRLARYSIQGATFQQVKSVGGVDIKEARSIQVIFAVLNGKQVVSLRSLGCIVEEVGEVKAI